MSARLVNTLQCPPGEFFIRILLRDGVATITHSTCSGTPGCYMLGPSPVFSEVAREYVAFLKANKLPGADFATAAEALDNFTCTRLGGAAPFCYDSEKNYAATSSAIANETRGGCCGANL